ncbi:Bug family tripartite tricarboxylate transporter substrate binding protein [Falsigemmobacter intermedius]|uniref:Bug family tripartite tricarboxylate transporter substrate binding protein n=1 Tax=Falsigemmobacter intermedius TaxID=1553448 RepID=UPI003F0F6AC8
MTFNFIRLAGAAVLAGLTMTTAVLADGYPNRPIRFLVPFAAGGTADAFARSFAPHISEALGQNVVVENMAGAGGAVGAAYLSRQEPDGYTVMLATPGTQITNPLLQKSLPYNPDTDFTVMASVLEAPNALVVPAASPATTVAELIELAKKEPGAIMYSSAGIGATSHLSGALFGIMAGAELEHVPYQGSGEAMPDLVAGRIDFTIDSLATVLPFLRSGELRALAVTTLEEHPLLPGVRPLAESLPGYRSSAINYLVAPAGVAPEVKELWTQKTAEVMAAGVLSARMEEMGITPWSVSLEELDSRIAEEKVKWGEVVKAVGIEPK